MEHLIAGYRRFRTEVWPTERARYESLARAGQRPETLVIACSDSRVDPQTVFGVGSLVAFGVANQSLDSHRRHRFRLRFGVGHSWHAVGSLVGQAIVPAGGLSGRRRL